MGDAAAVARQVIEQTAFLFGTQAAFVLLGLDATRLAVVWAHLLLVLPHQALPQVLARLGTEPLGAQRIGQPREGNAFFSGKIRVAASAFLCLKRRSA